MDNEVVFRFPKSEQEETQFSVREFKNQLYFDVRTFFQSEGGEWLPTKKGVTFSTGFYGDFRKGIEELGKHLSVSEEAV